MSIIYHISINHISHSNAISEIVEVILEKLSIIDPFHLKSEPRIKCIDLFEIFIHIEMALFLIRPVVINISSMGC